MPRPMRYITWTFFIFCTYAYSSTLDIKSRCEEGKYAYAFNGSFFLKQLDGEECKLTVACRYKKSLDQQVMVDCEQCKKCRGFYFFHGNFIESEGSGRIVNSVSYKKNTVLLTLIKLENKKFVEAFLIKGNYISNKEEQLKSSKDKVFLFNEKDGLLYSRKLKKCDKKEKPYILELCLEEAKKVEAI